MMLTRQASYAAGLNSCNVTLVVSIRSSPNMCALFTVAASPRMVGNLSIESTHTSKPPRRTWGSRGPGASAPLKRDRPDNAKVSM